MTWGWGSLEVREWRLEKRLRLTFGCKLFLLTELSHQSVVNMVVVK
jgi:hypothetical protein